MATNWSFLDDWEGAEAEEGSLIQEGISGPLRECLGLQAVKPKVWLQQATWEATIAAGMEL